MEDPLKEPGHESERWEPIDITPAVPVYPGEAVFVVDVKVKDVPGVILRVLEPLYGLGGNLVKLTGYRVMESGKQTDRGRIIAFFAFQVKRNGDEAFRRDWGTKMRESIRSMLAGLGDLIVGEAKVYGPYFGPTISVPPGLNILATSTRHGTARALLMRSATLQYIVDTLYWAFPSTSRPLALQALYMLGRFIGSYLYSFAETLLSTAPGEERMSRGVPGRRKLEEALRAMAAGGWISDFTIEEGPEGLGSERVLRIVFRDYWLRPPGTGEREGREDPLTVGILEELLEASYGDTWRVRLASVEPGKDEMARGAVHIYEARRLAS